MKRIFTVALMVATMLLIGCGESTTTVESGTKADDAAHNDHGHSHDNPPHGGTYADWGGGKYHVEFTVDHDKQEATVYILGDDAQTAEPIAAEEIQLSINEPKFQIALKAMPLEGEADGTASRFVGNHEGLGVVREYVGKIFGTVDGKAYSGDFKEEPHGH